MQTKQEILENLIISCAEEIEHTDITVANNNKARCPIIFIYFGKTLIENHEIIKEIINNNWRLNSKYIQHISAEKKENNIKLLNLIDSSEISEISEISVECEAQSATLDEIISSALAAPIGTFADNNAVMVKFMLSCTDDNFSDYLNFARELKTELNGLTLYKDLFIMLLQGGSIKEIKTTDNCIKSLYEEEKNKNLNCFKQIFFLSNRMKNGAFLDQFNKKTNYRLIADLSLLLDNDDDEYQNRKETFYSDNGKYRTMSHRIVQKPCREIVVVMLRTILKSILDTPKKDKEKIIQMFADEQFEENYFENYFENKLPKSEDFKYLPYSAEGMKILKSIYKNCKIHGVFKVDEEIISRETMGCYEDFYNLNYLEYINTQFNREDFRIQLENNNIAKYSFRDIIEYFKYEDIVETACQSRNNTVEKNYAQSLFSVIERHCFLKARNEYFELIKETYRSTMKGLYDEAVNFEKLMTDMQNDISSVCVIENKGIYQSIEKYYSDYIFSYFTAHKDEVLSLFNIRISTYEDLAETLKKTFMKILSIDTSNVLVCGFADELNNRLGVAATPANRDKIIKDALVPKINEYTRINVSNDTLSELCDAYFCDKTSDFIKAIGITTCFDTNDKNCFEHLKVYKFDSIRDILGVKMGVL